MHELILLNQDDQAWESIMIRNNIGNITFWILVGIASIFTACKGNKLYFRKIEKMAKAKRPYKKAKTSLISVILACICVVFVSIGVEKFISHGLIKESIMAVSERFFLPIFEVIGDIIRVIL